MEREDIIRHLFGCFLVGLLFRMVEIRDLVK